MRTVFAASKHGTGNFGARNSAEEECKSYREFGILAQIVEEENHILVRIPKTSPLLCTLVRAQTLQKGN